MTAAPAERKAIANALLGFEALTGGYRLQAPALQALAAVLFENASSLDQALACIRHFVEDGRSVPLPADLRDWLRISSEENSTPRSCAECAGTGWVEVTPRRARLGPCERTYSCVERCPECRTEPMTAREL